MNDRMPPRNPELLRAIRDAAERRAGARLDFEDVPEDLKPRRRYFPSAWALAMLLILTLIGAVIGIFVRGAWQLLLGGH